MVYYRDIFSWAEDKDGRMVYIDDVPRGASCGCVCPSCRENLIARHGEEMTHGFAHASKERGANLTMCLKVIMFKLAEQIIATEKRICVPSYYGIYKNSIIDFDTVEVNDCFEREDRQPDIFAVTKDNQKYLIEFCFKDYVRHRQTVDYENLNCLEIDLAGQSISERSSLKDFLINSDENRRWINNSAYFNSIEMLYQSNGKTVRLVDDKECSRCPIKNSCCAIYCKDQKAVLLIEHNERKYRLCKLEKYTQFIDEYNKQQEEYVRMQEEKQNIYKELLQSRGRENADNRVDLNSEGQNKLFPQLEDENINSAEKSCFDCRINLQWANKDGWAVCGCYERLGIPRKIKPDQAVNCRFFVRKNRK